MAKSSVAVKIENLEFNLREARRYQEEFEEGMRQLPTYKLGSEEIRLHSLDAVRKFTARAMRAIQLVERVSRLLDSDAVVPYEWDCMKAAIDAYNKGSYELEKIVARTQSKPT